MYWQIGAENILKSMDPSHFLHSQLASCFSVSQSPVWMDSSTTKQCQKLEDAVGGPEVMRYLPFIADLVLYYLVVSDELHPTTSVGY